MQQAGYPGSRPVPAPGALVSRLALKRRDKRRQGHLSDFNFDEALGLFAGLNVRPEATCATDDSDRTQRRHPQRLLTGWASGLAALLVPEGRTFCPDSHPIPDRGDPTGRDTPSIAKRREAGPGVLSSFAPEYDRGVLGYAHANPTRTDRPGERTRFVGSWHGLTGQDPQGLSFDSEVVPYPELSRVNRRGLRVVTIRRRGARVLRRPTALPAAAWRRAVIDTTQRRHRRGRSGDGTITPRGDEGPIRPLAVAGRGREQPPPSLSPDLQESGRTLIIRYTGRNRVEDAPGPSVNCFHLDCLASEVRLNGDRDVALTALAHGCYRWLSQQRKGFEEAAPKRLDRQSVETGGVIEVRSDRLVVRFDRRSHDPIPRQAARDRDCPPIPWLHGHRLAFEYP